MSALITDDAQHAGYRHEALFYAGHDEFVARTAAFIRDSIAASEPILVVLGAGKIDALRRALDDVPASVRFADMEDVGANPTRIIPAWLDFVSEHAGTRTRLRGIGEPISPARRAAELAECHRHEALLNVAFSDEDFWLLCPYDIQALDPRVIDEARRNHPFVRNGTVSTSSAVFPGRDVLAAPCDAPLPEPPADTTELAFQAGNLSQVRRVVGRYATHAGLAEERAADLVLAAYELGTNSVRYGGGNGLLRLWCEGGSVTCEVRDSGHLTDPLVGRIRPGTDAKRGRGLWLANQMCDLLQIRLIDDETVVRVHMRVD